MDVILDSGLLKADRWPPPSSTRLPAPAPATK
jgi:hypothetical protein